MEEMVLAQVRLKPDSKAEHDKRPEYALFINVSQALAGLEEPCFLMCADESFQELQPLQALTGPQWCQELSKPWHELIVLAAPCEKCEAGQTVGQLLHIPEGSGFQAHARVKQEAGATNGQHQAGSQQIRVNRKEVKKPPPPVPVERKPFKQMETYEGQPVADRNAIPVKHFDPRLKKWYWALWVNLDEMLDGKEFFPEYYKCTDDSYVPVDRVRLKTSPWAGKWAKWRTEVKIQKPLHLFEDTVMPIGTTLGQIMSIAFPVVPQPEVELKGFPITVHVESTVPIEIQPGSCVRVTASYSRGATVYGLWINSFEMATGTETEPAFVLCTDDQYTPAEPQLRVSDVELIRASGMRAACTWSDSIKLGQDFEHPETGRRFLAGTFLGEIFGVGRSGGADKVRFGQAGTGKRSRAESGRVLNSHPLSNSGDSDEQLSDYESEDGADRKRARSQSTEPRGHRDMPDDVAEVLARLKDKGPQKQTSSGKAVKLSGKHKGPEEAAKPAKKLKLLGAGESQAAKLTSSAVGNGTEETTRISEKAVVQPPPAPQPAALPVLPDLPRTNGMLSPDAEQEVMGLLGKVLRYLGHGPDAIKCMWQHYREQIKNGEEQVKRDFALFYLELKDAVEMGDNEYIAEVFKGQFKLPV